jgi:hypothetical protein
MLFGGGFGWVKYSPVKWRVIKGINGQSLPFNDRVTTQ